MIPAYFYNKTIWIILEFILIGFGHVAGILRLRPINFWIHFSDWNPIYLIHQIFSIEKIKEEPLKNECRWSTHLITKTINYNTF